LWCWQVGGSAGLNRNEQGFVEGRRREGSNAIITHEALAQVSATKCHYLTVAAPKPRYARQVRVEYVGSVFWSSSTEGI
jgi:hypothetical protein